MLRMVLFILLVFFGAGKWIRMIHISQTSSGFDTKTGAKYAKINIYHTKSSIPEVNICLRKLRWPNQVFCRNLTFSAVED